MDYILKKRAQKYLDSVDTNTRKNYITPSISWHDGKAISYRWKDRKTVTVSKSTTTVFCLNGAKASREYSGKLMLRVPKELHKALAEAAKANGVSLNQYALYKLAK